MTRKPALTRLPHLSRLPALAIITIINLLMFSLFALPVTPQADETPDEAVASTLNERLQETDLPIYYVEAGRTVDADEGGVVYLHPYDRTNEQMVGIVDLLLVVPRDGAWLTFLPGQAGYSAAFESLPVSIVRRIDTTPYKPTPDIFSLQDLKLDNYRLPWPLGSWGTVTRSFSAHGRGQIDFDLTGLDVAAAKAGTIIYINDSNELNAYGHGAWWYWNVVIIQHGSHEYSLYGHLAPNSVPLELKNLCQPDVDRSNCAVPVQAGQIIAWEGNTGYSTARHLHLEFGQEYGIAPYWDVLDQDGDGDRSERVYVGHVYAEQNIAFEGFSFADVAGWAYGTLQQADYPSEPPAVLENDPNSTGPE